MFEGSQGPRSRIVSSPGQIQSSQDRTQNNYHKERRTEEVSRRNNVSAEEEGKVVAGHVASEYRRHFEPAILSIVEGCHQLKMC